MPLNVGIIGLGVGEQHIAGYRAHPETQVTALCDIDPEKQAMAREKYPDIAFYEDADAVLSDPQIQVVSIASYDDVHAAQILKALAHDKHVFVEKPMCLFAHEARQIRAMLKRKAHLRLSSNLILRLSPRFVELKAQIQGGLFGELFYLEGDYNYGRLHKIINGWRGQLPFYSVVHGGGVHLIDLMMWLTGQRIVRVSAMGNQIASRGSGFRFPDLVCAQLEFENQIIAKMTVNFGCVHPHFHPLKVYGTQASFENGLEYARLYRERDPQVPPERVHTAYPGVHKGALLHSFISSLNSQSPPEVSTDEVFDAMSVCFAVEESLVSGKTVAVEYI